MNSSSYCGLLRIFNLHRCPQARQLTRQTISGQIDIEYVYSATANDGRITARKENISGEQVAYQYDSLARLTRAETTGGPFSGTVEQFPLDGFGNFNSGIPLATNRYPTLSYDNNGNQIYFNSTALTYDAANRIIGAALYEGPPMSFGYDPANRRVWKLSTLANGDAIETYSFYGADGQLMAEYRYDTTTSQWATYGACAAPWRLLGGPVGRVYAGGKLLGVMTDRLGSVVWDGNRTFNLETYVTTINLRRYTAYGTELGGATPHNQTKFATYYRDDRTYLDYAINRYYFGGRFLSPDPYRASGGPADPSSWNRYSYVQADPVNHSDRLGLWIDPIESPDLWEKPFWWPNDFPTYPLPAEPSPEPAPTQRRTYFLLLQGEAGGPADCYRVPKDEPVTRQISYRLHFMEDGMSSPMAYAAVIWEHVSGDLPVSKADSPSRSAPGWFIDGHSVLTG